MQVLCRNKLIFGQFIVELRYYGKGYEHVLLKFLVTGFFKTYLKGSVVEWFRALDLKPGGLWLESSTLLLSGFVLGSPEFNSSTALCK